MIPSDLKCTVNEIRFSNEKKRRSIQAMGAMIHAEFTIAGEKETERKKGGKKSKNLCDPFRRDTEWQRVKSGFLLTP